jgi:hypothetical protein
MDLAVHAGGLDDQMAEGRELDRLWGDKRDWLARWDRAQAQREQWRPRVRLASCGDGGSDGRYA